MTVPVDDHLQQPSSRVLILLVFFEVFRQFLYAFRKERNLNLGGTGIFLVNLDILDYPLLFFLGEHIVSIQCFILNRQFLDVKDI